MTNHLSFVVVGVAFGTFCATMLGGLAALQVRDKLHLILGFSAGAVIALAFFDLLPEALRIGAQRLGPEELLAIAALGFFAYMVLDRIFELSGGRSSMQRGSLGAASLSAHSLTDGLALGFAFQASTQIGIVVAVAILAHDCSDGINTVGLVLKNGGTRASALKWLALDASTPILGAVASLFVRLPPGDLARVLAAFAGFFLYIGASDLLPESFHKHPRALTTIVTLLGAATLYAVVWLAG